MMRCEVVRLIKWLTPPILDDRSGEAAGCSFAIYNWASIQAGADCGDWENFLYHDMGQVRFMDNFAQLGEKLDISAKQKHAEERED